MRQLAVLELKDLVGLAGDGQIMRHRNDRRIFGTAQGMQQPENELSCLRVQVTGRLISQDQLGTVGEGTGYSHTLLLTARKPGWQPALFFFVQPYLDQQVFCTLAALGGWDASKFKWQHNIFQGSQVRDQVVLLEHKADVITAVLDKLSV
jgi:hypothetical protein